MSTYKFTAKNKASGNIVTGTAIDDHFGRHQYGYQLDGEKSVMKQKTFDKKFEMMETPVENPDFDEDLEFDPERNDPRNRLFLLTDACMWEMNRDRKPYHPHAIEVVDTETGQVRYIESGAVIQFVEGKISDNRDQESYNVYANGTGK